ncbi:MAG: hypothetical protein AAF384_08395 [Pseudomonadota bacterium]
MILVLAIAAFLRLPGAELRSAADDEFYSTIATQRIFASGRADFKCMGWYSRAPFFHYLSAATALPGDDVPEVATLRRVSAFANILTILGAALIARRLGGNLLALMVASLLALSIWQIEFSRLGRMYSLCGSLFIWQCYTTLLWLDSKRRAHFCLSLGFFLLSALSWVGAMTTMVVPFLAWLAKGERPARFEVFALFATLLALACVKLMTSNPVGEMSSSLDFFAGFDPWIAGLAVVLTLFGLWTVRTRSSACFQGLTGLSILVVLLGAAGVLMGAAILLTLLVLLAKDERRVRDLARKLGIFLASAAAGWTLMLLNSGLEAPAIASRLITNPDVIRAFALPWFRVMPLLSFVLCAGFAATAIKQFLTAKDNREILLLAIVISVVALITLFPSDYIETRYTYIVYPLLLILGCVPLTSLLARLVVPSWRICASVLAGVLLFVLSEDHAWRTMFEINTYAQSFRVDMPRALSRHYYARNDYPSAASYIAEHRSSRDLVMASHQSQSLYLEDIDVLFKNAASVEFERVSCGDGRERWLGLNMIGTPQAVLKYVDKLPQSASLWFIGKLDQMPFKMPAAFANKYRLETVFKAADHRTTVVRITQR